MLRKFLAGQATTTSAIRSALDGDDWATAERLAHTTKGVAGNIGAAALQASAGALESALRERLPRQRVNELVAAFDAPLSELLAALVQHLPREEVETPAAAVDEQKLALVCSQLAALLAEDDSEATDLAEHHAGLLQAAFADDYRSINDAIRNFELDTALTALQAAMKKRPFSA